ncbi:MAG: YdgA family protein [Azoarcus sp.]|jgi:uncharacterized protein YdgA (DUF945 family)|nr:YdgA family protein [Azoarcus sp.]
MKTSVKIAIGVAAALAVAYPVSMPLAGKYIESRQMEMMERTGNEILKKIGIPYTFEHNFVRDSFSGSTYTYTITFELPQKDGKKLQLKLKDVSRIKHGLFVEGVSGIGTSDHEVTLEGVPEEFLVTLFGNNKSLGYKTVYTFSSIDYIYDSLPKIELNIGDSHVILNGIKGRTSASYDMKQLSGNVSFSEYSVENKLIKIAYKDLVGISSLKMIPDADNEPPCTYPFCLYTGQFQMTAASYNVEALNLRTEDTEKKTVLALQKPTFKVNVSDDSGFLDILTHTGAESLLINGVEYAPTNTPAQLDISFRHLQTRAVAQFYRVYLDAFFQIIPNLMEKKFDEVTQAKLFMSKVVPAVTESGFSILEKSPEIRIDRLYFMTPKGVVDFSASVSVKDFDRKDIANLDIWLDKLEVGLDAAVPVALVNEEEDLTEQIKFGKKEGFLTEKDNILSTKVKLKNNELTINGKPSPVSFSALRAMLKGSEGPSLDDIFGNNADSETPSQDK